MSEVDWHHLFLKYAAAVVDHEGVYHLYEWEWSPEEWAMLCAALELKDGTGEPE